MKTHLGFRVAPDLGLSDTDLLALLFALCALLFLFSGCALTQIRADMQADPNLEFFDAMSKVTGDDLDAALADAQKHGDVEAVTCYPVLKKYLSIFQDLKTRAVGIFSANQKKRDLFKAGKSGVPTDLKLACAAFIQDERDFALKFMALIGAAAGSGGAALPFFP